MTIRLNPYIGFRGNAREAVEFYHSVLGGTLNISTFADLHAAENPAENDLIMHSDLQTESGLSLMVSDTPDRMPYAPGTNFSVSLSGAAADEATLTGYWEKLSEGATILAPLEKAVWGDWFGMLSDKFGITWLVNISAA